MENNFQGEHPHNVHYKAKIDGKTFEFDKAIITIFDILGKVNKNPPSCYSVYKGLDGCDFRLIRPNEEIDLRELGEEAFTIKDPVVFNYSLNNEPEATDLSTMTPVEILRRGGINQDSEYLVEIFKDQPERVYAWEQNAQIKMICSGMEFITRKWIPIADLEQLGKNCQAVPVAKQYRIKIQNQYHLVNSPFLSEEQIIRLGGKPDVKRWDVLMFLSNQADPIKITKNQVIDLQRPCILFFVLQPQQQTEGRETKREFTLPAEDQNFLDIQSLPWETLNTPHGHCIIIHDFPIPNGYNTDKAQVALIIPPTYPAAQIDMAYFYPPLHVVTGKEIKALTQCVIDGRTFQRWSRHRAQGDWQAGVDNIATHLYLVKNWLTKELNQ